LFATEGTDLRGPMRAGASDDEIAKILNSVWQHRSDRYSEVRVPERDEKPLLNKVEMYRMGG
jgi:cyclic pyranopterin phosphate synthase